MPLEDYLLSEEITQGQAYRAIKLIKLAEQDNKIIDKVIEMVSKAVDLTIAQRL